MEKITRMDVVIDNGREKQEIYICTTKVTKIDKGYDVV